MPSFAISLIVFACLFGGAVFGVLLRRALPKDHLNADSGSAVKLGMGLVATMSALVLGLLVSSAKTFYDAQNAELNDMCAKIVVLDRVLARYGPEAKDARDLLRGFVIDSLNRVWPEENGRVSVGSSSTDADAFVERVHALSPKDDTQRALKAQAISIAIGLGQTRWLMAAQQATSVSKPFLVVLVFWLTVLFISFGLYAPRNATVIAAFFFAALSVSGAIFLILEMYTPYAGIIHISSAALRNALAHLGQ
jgi:hypothetical protein